MLGSFREIQMHNNDGTNGKPDVPRSALSKNNPCGSGVPCFRSRFLGCLFPFLEQCLHGAHLIAQPRGLD
ncbi:MAG: hypothetical protein KDC03_24110, partial [Flavobacteriales bacterium]|nr:hypothetical protein [Flavobacteriales bacterium]